MKAHQPKPKTNQSKSAASAVAKKQVPTPKVQTKLKVGQPNDKYEREADSVADHVVGMGSVLTPSIQKKPTGSRPDESLQKMQLIDQGRKKEIQARSFPHIMKGGQQITQLKPGTGRAPIVSDDVGNGIERAKGGGSPLPMNTRSQMESGIGSDFGNVRIHNDSTAHKLSAKLNAQAFTHGNDVFFNKGKYNPETQAGKHLLAHELTHTVQQTGRQAIQKQDEDDENLSELDAAIEDAFLALAEDIQEAKAAQDYESYAFLVRVELLLGSRSYNSIPEFDAFFSKAHDFATSETLTYSYIGQEIIRLVPEAFPVTWSDMFYDAMHLSGFDMEELQANAAESLEALGTVAGRIPPYLFDHGLPIPYKDLQKIKTFQLDFKHARMKGNHIVKDYVRAGFDFVGHGWVFNFVNTWNHMVENGADAIMAGEIVIKVSDYDNFIATNGNRVETMAERFNRTWKASTIEEAQDDETSLKEASLSIMFMSGLGSLAGVMGQWKYAFDLFSTKKNQTVPMLMSLEKWDRVMKGIEWAYELGYFGESGDHIWQSLKEHGWQLLGMTFLMIGALAAAHVFPPLGIALDVLLLIWAGVNVIGAIDDLVTTVKALHNISSVEDMQRKSGKLAQALVGDGLVIILELTGFLLSFKMLSGNIKAIKAANPNITTEQALAKAIEGGSEGSVISRTRDSQEFLKRNGNSEAARSSVAKSKGDLTGARAWLTELTLKEKEAANILSKLNNIPEEEALILVQKANLNADDILMLQRTVAKTAAKKPLLPEEASEMARILTRIGIQKHLIFSGANDINLIWGSQRYWGMTEGAVYGARLPVNTFWQRMKAMVGEKEGLVVFQGDAAKLFHAHEIEGGYSMMKRLLGQHKAGFGDIVFTEASKHGNTIIVTKARIDPMHAGRPKSAPDGIGTNTQWATARVWGRRIGIEPAATAVLPTVGIATLYMLYNYFTE